MDIVWIAVMAVFWVAMCEAVVGLHKLDSPKEQRS
jgi:hypothetical protein